MQNTRLAQRRHRQRPMTESLSSPGRADTHPERRHLETSRRSLVKYYSDRPLSSSMSRMLRKRLLPAQRRHFSSVTRAICEARRRIIREELAKLSSDKQTDRGSSSRIREKKQKLRAKKKAIESELADIDGIMHPTHTRQSTGTDNSDVRVDSTRRAQSTRSTQPQTRRVQRSIPHPARLIVEDRPNCRLRNNALAAESGYTLSGTRLGTGNDFWFRPNLSPDEHSPQPAFIRSSRPGALAIVEKRNCGCAGHRIRVGLKESDFLSPSLGLSSRKKEARKMLAQRRRDKSERLRSLAEKASA